MKILLLNHQDVQKTITMRQAISSVRGAFIELSKKEAILPMRSQITVKKAKGASLFMPAYLPGSHSLGAKIVSVFPKNAGKSLPTIHGLVIVLEDETGRPQAIMDGSSLTALRTGAASGVATELLANHEAETAAIFGAGTQGRTQLEAVCTVRSIRKVWVYDPDPQAAERFADDMGRKGAPVPQNISIASNPQQAAFEADVICTATTSASPVFEDESLKPGLHINGVGSYTPFMQEIPSQTVMRSCVLVDSISAAWEEAGDLIIPLQKGQIDRTHIRGEIGELAVGQIQGRASREEITFFKSVGVAVQDMAVARIILSNALSKGLGQEIDL
jgi:ornithine cyclodeaminase/alanine dehydrogenase-like protein (mu-crystallin family)